MVIMDTALPTDRQFNLYGPSGEVLAPYQRDSSYNLQEISRIFFNQDTARYQEQERLYAGSVWVYSIISAIIRDLASTPCGWYRPSASARGRAKSRQNWVPLWNTPMDRVLDQPNEWQDWPRFAEQLIVYLLSGGNAWIWEDELDSTGVPRSLLVFSSREIRPIRQFKGEPPQGWELTTPNGNKVPLPLDKVIHLMMPNEFDPFYGLPPWASAKTQIQADRSRVQFDKSFFDNNATPDAILTYKPGPLNRATRETVRESWYESHGGANKAGGLAVMGGDFDLKVLGITHSQSQFLDSRKFTRAEIASAYGFPIQLLNEDAGYGLSKDMLTVARILKFENAVMPVGVKIENAITKFSKYLKIHKNAKWYFDYDGLPVMSDILKSKADTAQALIISGIPINDVIDKLDMGFAPLVDGDVPLITTRVQSLYAAARDLRFQRDEPPEGEDAEEATSESTEQEGDSEEEETEDEAEDTEDSSEEDEARSLTVPSRLADISPLVGKLATRIKRQLFDLRNESYRNLGGDSPFDLAAALARWEREVSPFLVISAGIGTRHGSGANGPLLTEERIATLLRDINDMGLWDARGESDALRDVSGQVAEAGSLIRGLWAEIRNKGNTDEAIAIAFDELTEFSRHMADSLTRRARNAGEFHTSGSAEVHRLPRGCRHSGRYAGEPGQGSYSMSCKCTIIGGSK